MRKKIITSKKTIQNIINRRSYNEKISHLRTTMKNPSCNYKNYTKIILEQYKNNKNKKTRIKV